MAIDAGQTFRGALAGAVAAGVWAAQQPLDKRVFGVPYDDTELLGKLVTRRTGPARVIGTTIHLANGALFGAVYANLAPRLPLPPWARGPAVALAENFATWPLAMLSDRFHPARAELPTLSANRAALAQATWRHLLFGALLGALERRLSEPAEDEAPVDEYVISANGHGSVQNAVGAS